LAYTYNGVLHRWANVEGRWNPKHSISGHFKSVNDFAWDTTGTYLISTSQDQTTRIYCEWKDKQTWYEVSRPQVHGYDINALAYLPYPQEKAEGNSVNGYIVCGADEKILRVFESPFYFEETVKNLTGIELKNAAVFEGGSDQITEIRQEGSSQALGLMNKAKRTQKAVPTGGSDNEEGGDAEEEKKEDGFEPKFEGKEPPFEGFLLRRSLWPEKNKLYGHGYEIIAVACSHDGKFIASSCKSQSAEHSTILIWDAIKLTLITKLQAHNLTVVDLKFSQDSTWLLSVSRDRQWALFKRDSDDTESPYKLHQLMKPHARIIWSCSWSPDSRFFVTGSRDKKLMTWTQDAETQKWNKIGLHAFKDAITAVAINTSMVTINGTPSYLLALGFEKGEIHLMSSNLNGEEGFTWNPLHIIHPFISHSSQVKKLAFRPANSIHDSIQLASCSSDTSVRIFDVKLSL